MQPREGGESLSDLKARLLPEKRKDFERLIELDTQSRAVGQDDLDINRREIGQLTRALAGEVGGAQTLDRILSEAYTEHLQEGERNRRARMAFEANKADE